MKLHRILVGAVFAIGVGPAALSASAQGLVTPERERARIAGERAAAETRYAERQRECATRFVVTSCVEDAKRDRRETLTRLKLEQNRLDDGLRKQRAAERADAIRRRREDDAQRSSEAAQRPPREHAARDPLDRPSAARPAGEGHAPTETEADRSTRRPGEVPAIHARSPAARPGEGTRLEQEARSRATFDAAHRAAEARRAEIEARNAQRAATHKPSKPLPVPGAASAP